MQTEMLYQTDAYQKAVDAQVVAENTSKLRFRVGCIFEGNISNGATMHRSVTS